jgi:hypothetical protein
MGDASTLNAKSGHPGHQLLIVLVGQHPAIKGLEKSKNHRHKLGETLISLGRSAGTQQPGYVRDTELFKDHPGAGSL